MPTMNMHVVDDSGSAPAMDVHLDNLGDVSGPIPAATTSSIGGVMMAAHVASAAGDTVAKAEFEALLDTLEAAGVFSAS